MSDRIRSRNVSNVDPSVMRMLSANRDGRLLTADPFTSLEYQPPVVTAISEQYDLHSILKYANIYSISDGIYRKDGDVSGIINRYGHMCNCLLYTSDAADE